jgi:hypothetical protein
MVIFYITYRNTTPGSICSTEKIGTCNKKARTNIHVMIIVPRRPVKCFLWLQELCSYSIIEPLLSPLFTFSTQRTVIKLYSLGQLYFFLFLTTKLHFFPVFLVLTYPFFLTCEERKERRKTEFRNGPNPRQGLRNSSLLSQPKYLCIPYRKHSV